MKLKHSLTPYTKINSKWIKDLNTRLYTIKVLEENTGQTLSDINLSTIFSDPPPRVMTIKTKINTWDLIKLKNFCTAKESLKKDDPQKRKKYLQMKQPSKDSSPKYTNTTAKKHMKRYSTSLIIREMKIKTTIKGTTLYQPE